MSHQTLIGQPLTAVHGRGLAGRLKVPGDGLIAPLALMLGAVARGETVLDGIVETRDIKATLAALRAMGVRIARRDGHWHLSGLGALGLLEPMDELDFSEAETALTLLMGLVGPYGFSTRFSGSGLPPLLSVIEPLRTLGIEVQSPRWGRLPLALRGPRTGVPFALRLQPGAEAAKAAMLLAALALPGVSIVTEATPTPDHAERLLASFGADIKTERGADGSVNVEIAGLPRIAAQALTVPGDPDLAAFPVVAALIVPGSDVLIENVLMHPAGTKLIEVLRDMGGSIEALEARQSGGQEVADLRVRHSALRGFAVPAGRLPAAAIPPLAIAAAFAAGETRIAVGRLSGVADDTAAALIAGLAANGVAVRRAGDTLVVVGADANAKLGGGRVETNGQALIAMAFLVFGLATTEPVTVDDERAVAAIDPGFQAAFQSLGANFYKRWSK